ncbi:UNVERIFIED_CONTAM: hypothetical protein Sangu_2456300 [Sesamum angustifolium]|uniref:Uncharacterized protein n=1 Tax=Sesamum angustifolium TaxID=2727405 RepID=A0AAW2L049_9LAMI
MVVGPSQPSSSTTPSPSPPSQCPEFDHQVTRFKVWMKSWATTSPSGPPPQPSNPPANPQAPDDEDGDSSNAADREIASSGVCAEAEGPTVSGGGSGRKTASPTWEASDGTDGTGRPRPRVRGGGTLDIIYTNYSKY